MAGTSPAMTTMGKLGIAGGSLALYPDANRTAVPIGRLRPLSALTL